MTAITTEEQARAWRPEIVGWSDDILPYYSRIAEQMSHGGTFVELGVAHGRSLVYMIERRNELRKDFQVFGVDLSPKPEALDQASGRVPLPRYLQMDCSAAALLFADGTVDCVFIDSDHSLEGMRAQLNAWLPKVKPGGIIAGHDYSLIDWPGVVQAVDQAFGSAVKLTWRTVWEYHLPEQGCAPCRRCGSLMPLGEQCICYAR